jgi:putative transposase
VAGRKTYLFAFIDDHSRAVVGHRFGYAEDTVRLAAALRPALACRGVPESIYVDYANLMVMPTSPGTRCSAGVHEPMLSA